MFKKFLPQNKIVFLLSLVVIILIIIFMFNPFKKSSKYEIIETRDFSCPSMTAFTFKYPVFKKWENVSLNQESCELRIKDNTGYTFVTIRVSIGKGVLFALSSSLKKNEQGVPYILDSKNGELRFMLGDKSGTGDVSIKIFRLPIKQQNQNISGFSGDQFFKTIIESFSLKKETVNNSEYDYSKTLGVMAQDIATLKNEFPQLVEFSTTKNVEDERLVISYEYHTHKAERVGGWTSGVPNPDDDGVWFYIDFHEADSQAQIHTQPMTIDMCLGAKRVSFLMLEGQKTKSLEGPIWTILQNHGVKRCD